jgi:photosystem II stability/assembly factor-like uncharacterized protein
MKHGRWLAFCLLALSSVSSLLAQGFNHVHSSNGALVWAAGQNGKMFRSANGGVTWSEINLGTSGSIRGVWSRGGKVWAVGDSGNVYRSTNAGGNWQADKLAINDRSLNSVTFVSDAVGYAVGNSGTILKTNDGGATWIAQTSGITAKLNEVAFVDASVGYAVGDNATVLKTVNGGAAWTPITAPQLRENLSGVSARGNLVYVTGANEMCAKSSDGGTTWAALNFKTDSRSDVTGVFIQSPTNVYFIGGGGYIRRTTNNDGSYTFGQHPMHAPLTSIFFYDAQRGWAVNDKNNAIIMTTDGGATWQLSQGATFNYSWASRFSGSFIGSTLCISPFNKNTLYAARSGAVIKSENRGDTWTQIATLTGSVHSFYVSARDSNTWVAAATSPDRVARTTNAGQTWTTTIQRDFTSFGMPLEMSPDEPDFLIFASDGTSGTQPNSVFFSSRNFGETWDTLARTTMRSPCDVQITRGDSSNVILVGDGVTGNGQAQMWRSDDKGRTWRSIFNASGSEIPMLSNSSLNPAIGFGTQWGSGGVQRTTDFGKTWTTVSTVGSAWGTDVAKDDPTAMVFGVYGGGNSYLSRDAGTTFTTSSLTGANSGLLFYDRATLVANQTGGMFKATFNYTVPTSNAPVLTLAAPRGGEVILSGGTYRVEWAANALSTVNVEYRTSETAAWQTIATGLDALQSQVNFAVPTITTSEARVRVVDANNGALVSQSGLITFSPTASAAQASRNVPNGYALEQNYPNPFNPTTVINYQLPVISDVRLEVFDVLGRKVSTLVNERKPAGNHSASFNASTLSSGVYFYRLQTGAFSSTKRMLLVK